jgi:hypothetical protein
MRIHPLALLAVPMALFLVPAAAPAQLPPIPTVVPVPKVVPVPTVVPVPSLPNLPSVPVEPVPVPTVRVPSVPLPSLPSIGAPVASPRSAPPSSSAPAQRAPASARRAPATPAPSAGSPATTGGDRRAPAPAQRAASGRQSPSSASATRAFGGRGRGSAAYGPARTAARQRKFTRAVRQLASCLDELPTLTERVLRLRSGIGPGDALSRQQVSRRIDRPRAAVRRMERRGLERLRAACGPATAAPDGSGAQAATVAGGAGGTAVAAVGGSGGEDDPRDTVVGTEREASAGEAGGVKGEQAERTPLVIAAGEKATDLALPLLLVVGAGLAWIGVRDLRRRGLLG